MESLQLFAAEALDHAGTPSPIGVNRRALHLDSRLLGPSARSPPMSCSEAIRAVRIRSTASRIVSSPSCSSRSILIAQPMNSLRRPNCDVLKLTWTAVDGEDTTAEVCRMTAMSTNGPSNISLPSARREPTVVICGGGNAGHALAVAASQNFSGDIDWLVGSEGKAGLLRRGVSANGLRSTGVIEARADRLRLISSDPALVIPGADIVLVAVPAFGHSSVLARIGPYLSDTVTVGVLPTRGGLEFEAWQLVRARGGGTRGAFFGLQTLPWSARVVTPGEVVHFGAVKASVVLAALPAAEGPTLACRLSEMLGTHFVATEDFLSLTLGNPGQFIHPCLMYGHFRHWRGEEYDESSIPMFYAGATDEMGHLVEQVSREATEVARAIEAESGGLLDLRGVVPVHDWLRCTYAHVTVDMSTVGACFRTGPIKARKAPVTEIGPERFVPNFDYRYLSEDVPYGLVITRALAELARVATPTTDKVIRWAQFKMKKVYLTDASVDGPDAKGLPIPQRYGISRLSELLAWYEAAASAPLSPTVSQLSLR